MDSKALKVTFMFSISHVGSRHYITYQSTTARLLHTYSSWVVIHPGTMCYPLISNNHPPPLTPPKKHSDIMVIFCPNTPKCLAIYNPFAGHYHTLGTQNPGFFSPALSFRLRFFEMLTLILKMPWQSFCKGSESQRRHFSPRQCLKKKKRTLIQLLKTMHPVVPLQLFEDHYIWQVFQQRAAHRSSQIPALMSGEE